MIKRYKESEIHELAEILRNGPISINEIKDN